MIFKASTTTFTPATVTLNNITYTPVNSIKFLSVHVDSSLNWSTHIETLCKQLNTICYGFRNLKAVLDFSVLLSMYYGLFYSRMKYGILLWGRSSGVGRIFIAQKRVVRLIVGLTNTESCRTIFRRHNILTVHAIYIYECVLFFKKNPQYFFNARNTHEYNTRLRDMNYIFPIHRLTLTEKGLFYSCVQIYNKLPVSIKTSPNLYLLKQRLRSFLINLEPYSLNEYFIY